MRINRRAERGLTLIEIAIALLIAAVLFSAVVTGVGAITGSKAKAAAGELAGIIRSLYDTAALSGKTCRLVFEIPDAKSEGTARYHAECAASGVTTARNRDDALKEENRTREDQARFGDDRRNFTSSNSGGAPSLQELMAQEENRVEDAARFSSYTNEELAPRELPSSVSISVWTRQQKEPVHEGVAYLYFFPQGYTEKAQVYVRQGDNVWTLSLSPLTGKVAVVGEELEVPKS
ncbi:pilus assembly FimT family protein [Stigmatella aurantiaca]|uniref:Prepilin-type N-terminal cleavage/methylation domain protein n=1 Tax=Stigmatella aurantiaca (strain DW4/3-1) TaxID=378806 RepID=Q08NC3_STIAD|nr:prepilin-type N-terminal cleavage/methylation domain-containing protein [Stigmatella aurantiaca]ADO70982.1 Prepilin-type N-terminal cleavage/methylation domain protein [Stigmatella aurantiaca DW4/3-1]EAU61982.1 prokaryotic N-terminal methylation motif domain protein [Stigmatella aurantiaca DW4/3-1]